jgi:hypothetical protein
MAKEKKVKKTAATWGPLWKDKVGDASKLTLTSYMALPYYSKHYAIAAITDVKLLKAISAKNEGAFLGNKIEKRIARIAVLAQRAINKAIAAKEKAKRAEARAKAAAKKEAKAA